MNRRQFTGHLVAGAATLAVVGSTLTMEGCNVDWITTAINDLPTIVSIATTVATIVADALGGGILSPAVAAIIQTASQAAQVALATAQQLIKDYQAQPSASVLAKIKTTLLDVQSSLGQILDAAHIANVALRTVIAGSIGLAITVLTQILSLLPASTTALAMKAQASAAIKPLSSTETKKQVNGFLNANGYGKYAIQ